MIRIPEFLATRQKQILAILIACIATYVLFPPYFQVTIYPPDNSGPAWYSLDPSWQFALNHALTKGLTWGKQVVFTYGPLAFLSTKISFGVSRIWLFLFDLFVATNFLLLFYRTFLADNRGIFLFLHICIVVFLFPTIWSSGFMLNGLLLFWIWEGFHKPSVPVFLMQITLCVLLFFMKLNTGFFSIFFFLASVGYASISGLIRYRDAIIYLLLLVFAILISSTVLHVSIPSYIANGLEIVRGY